MLSAQYSYKSMGITCQQNRVEILIKLNIYYNLLQSSEVAIVLPFGLSPSAAGGATELSDLMVLPLPGGGG